MTHRFMMFEFALNVATNKGCLSHIVVPHHNHLQVPITIPWNTEQRILNDDYWNLYQDLLDKKIKLHCICQYVMACTL